MRVDLDLDMQRKLIFTGVCQKVCQNLPSGLQFYPDETCSTCWAFELKDRSSALLIWHYGYGMVIL